MSGDPAQTPLLQNEGGLSTFNPAELNFYDPDVILDIGHDVAQGYLILLTGGAFVVEVSTRCRPSKKEKKKKKTKVNRFFKFSSEKEMGQSSSEDPSGVPDGIHVDESAVDLAFMAITDGNIIDACFGVRAKGKQDRLCCIPISTPDVSSDRAKDAVRQTTNALREAGYGSEDIKLRVVKSYVKCFSTIIWYHDRMKGLGLLTRCWRHSSIEKKLKGELDASFRGLKEAIEAAM